MLLPHSPTARFMRKVMASLMVLVLTVSWIFPSGVSAQSAFSLPAPGMMVNTSAEFAPVMLRGIVVNPQDPFRFNFIVDTGEQGLANKRLKDDSTKLIKYFLAALTVPEKDLWVNLSPYEKDRIIPDEFGYTDMGRDLLAQDYLLKQFTASIIYPETELGKSFWDRIYQKARQLYGHSNIAVNTFNKVWIVPDKAVIYQKDTAAFVAQSHLKVMLEGDYLALRQNMGRKDIGTDRLTAHDARQVSDISSAIVQDLIIPEIEKEVNEGKHFTHLRQIYNSVILATWYKRNLQESFLGKTYVNQNRVTGIDIADKQAKEKIYRQYLEAFKKGVYNYIREDIDPVTKDSVPRKYFSGGASLGLSLNSVPLETVSDPAAVPQRWPLVNVAGGGRIVGPLASLQSQPQIQEPSGGLMARWRYQLTKYNAATGQLTLVEATRIPRNDGTVEDEFAYEEPASKVRNIVLKTRTLAEVKGAEAAVITALRAELGVPDDIQIRAISADSAAVDQRVYGVAEQKTIFLREEIFQEGSRDQIKEALDHEFRELQEQDHKKVRQTQFTGGLRDLIRRLSTRDKIKKNLTGNRNLIFSDQVDAIDEEWSAMARQQGRRYLRVTVHDQEDLDRLKTTLVVKNGQPSEEKGVLFDVIEQGGMLLLDYSGSDPKFIEGLNSLFDDAPFYEFSKASGGLEVVAVIRESDIRKFHGAVFSRLHKSSVTTVYADPVDAIKVPSAQTLEKAVVIDLHRSPKIREELVGKYEIDPDGNIQVIPGVLTRAIREGRPLVLRGADMKNPRVRHALRQLLTKQKYSFNGEEFTVPDQFIFQQERDYREGVVNKRLVSKEETQMSDEKIWVINQETQDLLFGQVQIRDTKLTQRAGLLRQPRLRLLVTQALDDWVWHRIMHANAEIEVDVVPGVRVPSQYSALRSVNLKNARLQRSTREWKDSRDKKVVLVEGRDLDFIESTIVADLQPENVVTFPVTQDTTLQDILTSPRMDSPEGKTRLFYSDQRGVLRALQEGKTVILHGLHNNPQLMRDLETALQEDPYLYVNGERVDFSDARLKGRLILTHQTKADYGVIPAVNAVSMNASPEQLAAVLQRENPARFNEGDFKKILELREVFNKLPVPSVPGLYPQRFSLDLGRLRLMYQYDSWLEAFEKVVIAGYTDAPEVAAFMRVMTRLKFNQEEPGRSPRSIHGRKLSTVLNKTVGPIPWSKHFWEFTDALSLDQLREMKIAADFTAGAKSSSAVFLEIHRSLVKHYQQARDADREKFYRHKFKLDKIDVSAAAVLDMQTDAGLDSWPKRQSSALQALRLNRMAMLKGPPGTGKSFITRELGTSLGYADNEVFGPVTTGSDTHQDDIVTRRIFNKALQQTRLQDETVARWAKAERGLLIVDEANLTEPSFWNMFHGLTAAEPYVWVNGERVVLKDHRVIFTGNNEFLTGRKFQELIQDKVITVPFGQFDRAFFKERLTGTTVTPGYIRSQRVGRSKLIDLILDIHELFQRMNPNIAFSLRDIQELADRTNILLSDNWTQDEVVVMAWDLYAGYFSAEEREALHYLVGQKFGTAMLAVKEKDMVDKVRAKTGEIFTIAGEREEVVVTDSTALMIDSVESFLAMRQRRIALTEAGQTVLQGKRGMIFEGPPGRGKDAVLIQVLKSNGYVDAAQAGAAVPANKKYYLINAQLHNYELMLETIRKAQGEGAMVIIREMNLLPSAFLEGRLNDVLTGNAKEGFALFATINSFDFSGKEKLSTALQNRVIYKRISDYTQLELFQIAKNWLPVNLQDEFFFREIRYALNVHIWMRQQIQDPQFRPTFREVRDLLNGVLARTTGLRNDQFRSLVRRIMRSVYGTLYLNKILGRKTFPSETDVERVYQAGETDTVKVLEKIAGGIIPSALGPVVIRTNSATTANAYYQLLPAEDGFVPTITIRTQLFSSLSLLPDAFHEASHGRFTREFSHQLRGADLDPLYQDLEDLWHEASFLHYSPYSHLGQPNETEKQFARMVMERDAGGISNLEGLTPRKIFQYSLLVYAKGLVQVKDGDPKQIFGQMAELFDALYPPEVNPFRRVLNHLDTAKAIRESVPATLDEEEIQFQQFRVLRMMETMIEDFEALPTNLDDFARDKSLTEEKIAGSPAEALQKLQEGKWQQRDLRIKEEDLGQADPGSAQDLAKKKQALARQAQHLRAKAKERLSREFDVMFQDLLSTNISEERLQEMEEQLTDAKKPWSLAPQIQQANDPQVNRLVQQILQMIEAVRQGREASMEKAKPGLGSRLLERLAGGWSRFRGGSAADQAQKDRSVGEVQGTLRQGQSLPEKLLGRILDRLLTEHRGQPEAKKGWWRLKGQGLPGISGGIRGGTADEGETSGQGEIGRRYNDIHNITQNRAAEERAAVTLSKPNPRPADIQLTSREADQRAAALQNISIGQRSDLQVALDYFFRYKLDPDRVYGQKGVLDVQRLISGDLATAFVSSGGRFQQNKKDIVLSGDLPFKNWNPVLEELFHFIFESGFRVTVYTSDTTYVEGIVTLGDLKRVWSMQRQVKPQAREDDLAVRKQRGDYEIVDLTDLQRQVEAIYLYGAMRAVLQKKQVAVAPTAPEPGPVKPTAAQAKAVTPGFLPGSDLTRDEQIARIKTHFAKSLLKVQVVETVPDADINIWLEKDGGFKVQLSTSIRLDDLEFLRGAAYLTGDLSLVGLPVTDISPLHGLAFLRLLDLRGTKVTRQQIYELFKNHPLPQMLSVVNAQGGSVSLESVFESDPVPAAYHPKPLSYADQLHLLKVSMQMDGIWDEGVVFSAADETFGLDFTGKRLPRSAVLGALKGLTHLNVEGQAIFNSDVVEVLLDLPNLKWLHVEGTPFAVNRFDVEVFVKAYIARHPDTTLQVGITKTDIIEAQHLRPQVKREQISEFKSEVGLAVSSALDITEDNFVLNLGGVLDVLDVPDVRRFTMLDEADLSDSSIINLAGLHGLNLRRVNLQNTSQLLVMLAVDELFRAHPKPEELTVVLRDGREVKGYQAFQAIYKRTDAAAQPAALTDTMSQAEALQHIAKVLFHGAARTGEVGGGPGYYFDLTADSVTISAHELPQELSEITELKEVSLKDGLITDISALFGLPLRAVDLTNTAVYMEDIEQLFTRHPDPKKLTVILPSGARIIGMAAFQIEKSRPLLFEEQVAELQRWARKRINQFDELVNVPTASGPPVIEVNLRRLGLENIEVPFVERVPQWGVINFSDNPLQSIPQFVYNLPNLRELDLTRTRVTFDQIWTLFNSHLNAHNLRVVMGGEVFTLDRMRSEFGVGQAGLLPNQEVNLVKMLSLLMHTSAPTFLNSGDPRRGYVLDLVKPGYALPDLEPLRRLTHMVRTNLSVNARTDLTPLAGMSQLQVVGLWTTKTIPLENIRDLYAAHPNRDNLMVIVKVEGTESASDYKNYADFLQKTGLAAPPQRLAVDPDFSPATPQGRAELNTKEYEYAMRLGWGTDTAEGIGLASSKRGLVFENDLLPLLAMSRLVEINVKNLKPTDQVKKDILRFLALHPNKKLTINLADGKSLSYADYDLLVRAYGVPAQLSLSEEKAVIVALDAMHGVDTNSARGIFTQLNFTGVKAVSLAPFLALPNVRFLGLRDGDVPQDQIEKFLVLHPNEALQVASPSGQILKRTDAGGKKPAPAQPPSPDKTELLKVVDRILQQNSAGKISYPSGGALLRLTDLGILNNVEFKEALKQAGSAIKVLNLREVAELTYLEQVSPLLDLLPNLTWVNVTDSGIHHRSGSESEFIDKVFRFISHHPNRRQLTVFAGIDKAPWKAGLKEAVELHRLTIAAYQAEFQQEGMTVTLRVDEPEGGAVAVRIAGDYRDDYWQIVSEKLPLTTVVDIHLTAQEVENMDALMGDFIDLHNLKALRLWTDSAGEPGPYLRDQIAQLFSTHPNRENLGVIYYAKDHDVNYRYADFVKPLPDAPRPEGEPPAVSLGPLTEEGLRDLYRKELAAVKRGAPLEAGGFMVSAADSPEGGFKIRSDLQQVSSVRELLNQLLTFTTLREISFPQLLLSDEAQDIFVEFYQRHPNKDLKIFWAAGAAELMRPPAGLPKPAALSSDRQWTVLRNFESVHGNTTSSKIMESSLVYMLNADNVDLRPLLLVAGLQELVLQQTNLTLAQVLEFLRQHPNRQRLLIRFQGKPYTEKDLPSVAVPKPQQPSPKVKIEHDKFLAMMKSFREEAEQHFMVKIEHDYDHTTSRVKRFAVALIPSQFPFNPYDILRQVPFVTELSMPWPFGFSNGIFEHEMIQWRALERITIDKTPGADVKVVQAIEALLRAHPNRANLVCVYDGKEYRATSAKEPEVPVVRADPVLVSVANALVNPAAALTEIQRRFTEDGQENELTDLLKSLRQDPDTKDNVKKAVNNVLNPPPAVRQDPAAKAASASDQAMLGKAPAPRSTAASVDSPPVGGIDLNPAGLQLQIKGEGGKINWPVDPNTSQPIPLDGLSPVIYNIVPIPSIQFLLGEDVVSPSGQRLSRK